MRGRLSSIVSSTWTDALTLVLETLSVRRLFVVYSPPPPAIPLCGGLVRKWIVMWWLQGKYT
jgi:hypothetical protein